MHRGDEGVGMGGGEGMAAAVGRDGANTGTLVVVRARCVASYREAGGVDNGEGVQQCGAVRRRGAI